MYTKQRHAQCRSRTPSSHTKCVPRSNVVHCQNNGYAVKHKGLSILDNTNLRGPQNAAVEHEALLLCVEANAILLLGLRRHEDGLMHIGVELLASLAGVESFQAVLL
jgi:hypothetical protein